MSDHELALNLMAEGDWDGAHQLIQQHNDALACQIHGYLHRIEGDLSNAAYWYHRASMEIPANSITEEAQRLRDLLSNTFNR
jgi:hypothetical protein